jgi:hypothetical protein
VQRRNGGATSWVTTPGIRFRTGVAPGLWIGWSIGRDGVVRFVQGQLLKPFPYSGKADRRYLCVRLIRDGVRETRPVHQLVLEAFVGPRPDGALGCHWDDDHENNDLSNLRWCTPLANAHDRARNCRLRRALAVIQTW